MTTLETRPTPSIERRDSPAVSAHPPWLLAAARAVLVLGGAGWVLPHQTSAVVGPWAVPVLALAAAGLAVALAREWRWLRLWMFLLAVMLLQGWRPSSEASTAHVVGAYLGLLAMVTVSQVVNSARRLQAVTGAYLMGGAVLLAVGLIAVPSYHSWPQVFESVLPFSLPPINGSLRLDFAGVPKGQVNPNALAAAALLIVPMGLVPLWGGGGHPVWRWSGRVLGLAVAVVGLAVMAISQSRTAALAVWVTVLTFLVMGPRSRMLRATLGVVVGGPVILAILVVAALSRESTAGQARDLWDAVQSRREVMAQGVTQARLAPWFGIGVGTFREAYVLGPGAQEGSEPAHAHNIVLQTVLDIGVLGSLAYWGLLGCILGTARRTFAHATPLGRGVVVGAAMALIASCAFGLADAIALGAKIGMLQWMLGGLILAVSRLSVDAGRPVTTPISTT